MKVQRVHAVTSGNKHKSDGTLSVRVRAPFIKERDDECLCLER